ncbi:MAG TPA: DUF5655 domain-containing protein [Roseiflexaceae bacterium]|nr:DUF5655 domain-containing protein [Roseiflexaceae bacterium]
MATFDTLVGGKPAPVQATARAARAYIRSLGADVAERFEGGEATYLRSGQPFCAIAVEGGAALLHISAGPSPDSRRGERSVLLRVPTDLSSAVRALIRSAYDSAR